MLSISDTVRVRRPAGLFTAAANARIAVIMRVLIALAALVLGAPLMAQEQGAGEANLHLPDLHAASFLRSLGGINGHSLLLAGLVVSALGLVFGLMIFVRLRNMPVHTAMREVSELIYETCKTYLATQGKFLMLLEAFIAVIIVFYFGFLQGFEAYKVADHPGFQRDRNRRQLLCGGLRHARKHLRQLPHRVRRAQRQSVCLL